MTKVVLREAILPRMDGIQKNLKRLKDLAKLSCEEFSSGDSYDLAQHHLRLALEGVFHISSHILSRLPGMRAVEYKQIAKQMGEQELVPKPFADKALVAMAGLRNILVHNYHEIDPKKLYSIVNNHLSDIELFLSHIKVFVQNPQKFGLEII